MCFPKFLASVGSLELLSTYRQEFREDVLPAEKISPENLFIPGKAQHKQSQGQGLIPGKRKKTDKMSHFG